MKEKGFLLLLVVGIGFLYFVFDVVGKVENEDLQTVNSIDSTTPEGRRQQAILQYYKQDITGTSILDLSDVPLEEAKRIWKNAPTKNRILKLFPNFSLMKDMIKLRVAPSEFRDYLLQKVDDIEGQYLSGSISSFEAKEALSNLD